MSEIAGNDMKFALSATRKKGSLLLDGATIRMAQRKWHLRSEKRLDAQAR